MNESLYRVAQVTAGYELGFSFTPLEGKRPKLPGWQARERESLEEAIAWAEAGNVSIRTGSASGVVGIDVDPGGDASGLELPPTVTALTGREGGRHFYYRSNGTPVGNSASKLGRHIDVKGENGQLVYPGSVHPETKVVYRWAPGLSPSEIGLATLPQSIADKLTDKPKSAPGGMRPVAGNYGTAALEGEVVKVRDAPEGERNQALNAAAYSLGGLVANGNLDREVVRVRLHEAALAAGLDEQETAGTIESGLSSGTQRPRVIHTGDRTLNQQRSLNSDVGNAARFAIREADKLRHCFERSTWLVWDGRRWAPDNAGTVTVKAKQTALSIFDEAKAAEGDHAEELGKWAVKSQRRERLAAMVELAKCELPIRARELDAGPWAITVLNGTLDLQTGQIREHRQDDFITRLAPVTYDPSAASNLWEAFLGTSTGGNAELAAFLQRAAGYSLTGDTREEVLFFIHGPAAAGKTTFIEAVKSALGEYGTTADFETFLEQKSGGPRNDIARLDGARMVVSVEVTDGRRLAQGLVKQVTGGDTVAARFLYRESFEFLPKFKLWLVANHTPRVDSDDDAMWRRILRIPFEHVVPPEQRDSTLKAQLRTAPAEQAAVFTWLVRGCLNWREVGLAVPEPVTVATTAYREDMNPLGDFLQERCILGSGYQVEAGRLRTAYLQYAEAQGLRHTLSPRTWSDKLKAKGCEQDRGGGGLRLWVGIGLCE